ncbi:hypothetical protein AMTRI_Chr04g188450 [Amborella trichopoda]
MYSVAVALDFTENMLKECYGFVKQESITTRNLVLVRADISRLPFVTSSVDAVHAGAAIHCCLSPSTAASHSSFRKMDTFLVVIDKNRFLLHYIEGLSNSHIYLSEGELEDICTACGLIDFKCKSGTFIMMSATKPT